MATDLQHYSDTWHQDLPLVAHRPGRDPEHALAASFQTARTLGGITGASPGGSWSFEPGLPPGYDLQTLHLLNCGYRLVSADEVDLLFFQVRPGVFLGNFPVSAVPELFCTRQTVTEEGPRSTLQLGEHTIELTQDVRENRRWVRLTVQIGDPHKGDPADAAPEPETDLRALWTDLWKQRMLWLTRMKAEERPVLFDLALEVLESGLHPPAGTFPAESLSEPGVTPPGLNLLDLPGLLPALTRMEPESAGALLETLCHIAPFPNGALPAFAPLNGAEAETAVPAWPALAIAVRTARKGDAPLPLPSALLPRLESHIRAWIELTDGKGPLPVWPDADTAFTPEIVDEDVDLCDLAALLIAEIDAYRDLSKNSSAFKEVRERWRAHLLEHHWSAPRAVFLDRTRDGALTKRMTLGGLLPLLWHDLPEEHQRGLYRALSQSKGLRGDKGLLQWEPREDDPAPAPVRTLSQHLFMRPLLLDAPVDIRTQMGLSWARALDDHVKTGRGFPLEWDGDSRGWHPLTAAFCLRFAPLHAKEDLELGRYPGWVRFLERQRGSIIGTAATLAIVIPITLGLFFALRPHYSVQQEQSFSGHGETMIALGRYAEAEEVYTELINRTRRPTFHLTYFAQRGNVRARQNKLAAAREDLLRAVELDQDLILPTAHWNLAQVHWRLGDLDAARDALEEFIDIFEEGYPDMGRRARNALALMDRGLNPFPSATD
ncbi:MAG: tetratricopeptide repeat protein [Verrucomicrobia bacterium]|nr:tetratricopeptide repeat protein [Verrucomicrobiota bacterium]